MSSPSLLPKRSCDEPWLHQDSFKVFAAGALPWRIRDGELQVLLIHRPKYDDWSFPKGKLDQGETMAECAIREVHEEVGLRITLGLALPAIRYQAPKGPKVVLYWAAHVKAQPQVDRHEVDRCRWCTVPDAAARLSNDADQVPLRALAEAAADGCLDTVPFVLARHAKAKPRSGWTRAEGDRPLATSGVRQSKALSSLLMAWRPERIRSSPWKRCVQTVTPYAARLGLQIKTIPALTEHAAKRDPDKAVRSLQKLLTKARPQVVCTHRPVLPILLPDLAACCQSGCEQVLPQKDPYLRPGSVIVAHRPKQDLTRVVSVEVHEPFDD